MILSKKVSRSFFFSLFLSASTLTLAPIYSTAPAQAASEGSDIESIKQALLNDPLFLSHLRDRLSLDSMNEDTIRQYLLKNPEVLIEMQDILVAKSNQQKQSTESQTKMIKENMDFLYHTPGDYVLGNKNAKITFVEFYDYNCQYCKKDFPAEKKIAAENKNVKFIMKDYPILGDDSVQAHMVAYAVREIDPKRYPAFHEKLMTTHGRSTLKSATAVAVSLGVNKKQLEEKLKDPALQDKLFKGANIAYQLGFNYTPVFILGSQVIGAVSMDNLAQIIANEEKKLAASKK